MKTKIKLLSRNEFNNWIAVSNLFAKSFFTPAEALKQFNMLSAKMRHEIFNSFNSLDIIRRQKLPIGESSSFWELSVFVDTHIIATEYSIDPLTVIMCIHPPCKSYERVCIK